MAEVASLIPADHTLTSVRHYAAKSPAGLELVEPGETFATTKEEEWVSKKKTEVTNTKQIETRVKRQVVLEDGKVVEDSGPMVTTNTTEDSETQEHHQTELRKLGDGDQNAAKTPGALEEAETDHVDDKSNWIAVPNSDGVVREVKERRVVSREEIEEVKETEDIQHLGDITDEEFLSAIRSGKSDLRQVIRSKNGKKSVISTGPRLIHESTKGNKIIDTEDTRELSSVLPDGKIVTETQRTTEHEEIKDDELPPDAPEQNFQKESSQRYLKTRDQEDVDYLADGVQIGHEMRFKTETMEVERRGDGVDETDFDSLSARVRRRTNQGNNRQPHRYRGLENGAAPVPLDRKDALTRRPLDFDKEEETRKVETSKWLEHHFGSDSRSSNNSTIDDEEHPPKTSFFNVTIKSQSPKTVTPQKTYVTTVNSNHAYSPIEPERDQNHSGYYKGISDWSERRQDLYTSSISYGPSPTPVNHRRSPIPDYRPQHSPTPDYRSHHSPTPDYNRPVRISPKREIVVTPTPPQRKRSDRHRQRIQVEERGRYRMQDNERREEPPPDYSPPSPPPMPTNEKKILQRTRFAADPPTKVKSGNIIGQSIRKLVGKIRSASAERKARQRAKRSPSPSYQPGHVIDNNIGHNSDTMDLRQHAPPVQRYYLGEDPFAGSIYGRENKYDGVKPARSSRRNNANRDDEQLRSQSTLGRFSKSTSRLVNTTSVDDARNSQTLPRHLNRRRHEPPTRLENQNRSNSTINVSFINTVSHINEPPAKPARTYRSNLTRSKSLNVHDDFAHSHSMYTSNPHLHRLDENPIGLKSPGLISSLDRSPKDVSDDVYTNRFVSRNDSSDTVDNKRTWKQSSIYTSTPFASNRKYNNDIYEPPTRLRDSHVLVNTSPTTVLRRGSNSSTDFSETYHTTTRNDDPYRPSVTNTVKSFTKKTIPAKDGRSLETIESSETKSVTKSHYRSGSGDQVKYYDSDKIQYSSGTKPVVIEVRNYRK